MDTEQLTSILRGNGYLGDAVVVDMEMTSIDTNGIGSEFYAAELTYSNDDHTLPARMLIKRPSIGDRGQGEADVYERVLGRGTDLPILTCYGIVDEDPERGLLFLFGDLSDSHGQTPWPIVPKLADCEGAVTALAAIHAHWWGRTESIDAPTPQVVAHQDANHLVTYFSGFVDLVGEYLPPTRIQQYERVFSNLELLLESRLTSSNSTLLHNDSHFWNFLYSNDSQPNKCVIFDWPLWRTGLGGCDLAYTIASHLYPEHRRRFEPLLLDRYWQSITANGVAYDRQDVQLDYRIGVIVGLLMPVMEFSWKIPPLDWMPKLEKGFAAYEELKCSELLGTA